jgi:hypothetical protein
MSEALATQTVKVRLPNDVEAYLEVTPLGGEERISTKVPDFSQVIGAIQGVAEAVKSAVARVAPDKFSVELGVDVGLESGQLTALIVKGTGKANLKVTLVWGK